VSSEKSTKRPKANIRYMKTAKINENKDKGTKSET